MSKSITEPANRRVEPELIPKLRVADSTDAWWLQIATSTPVFSAVAAAPRPAN